MKKNLVALGFACFLLASCMTPGPGPVQETGKTASAEGSGQQPAEADVQKRMEVFLANGIAKINDGSISEGAQSIVAALAERQKISGSSKQLDDIARKAEAELTRLGTALSLDSGTEWVDENKNQKSASVLDVGTAKALQPSVVLSYNMGQGRTLVAGAPIVFEFVKGSGTLTGYVTTNEYGQATCSLAKLDSQVEEQVIRASLVYRLDGFTYKVQGVEKDFVFIPPASRATILVLERSATGANSPPIILDSVYNTLKGVAFDFSQYDGVLLGNAFTNLFAGDPKAIKALGIKKDVSYLVMVLSDCGSVNQMVVDGKTYNIWKSSTTATTRIIRVEDGKILYSGVAQNVAGQGNAVDKATLDGFRKAAEEMAAKLKLDLPEISKVLARKGS